jgi:hypothetical protein
MFFGILLLVSKILGVSVLPEKRVKDITKIKRREIVWIVKNLRS